MKISIHKTKAMTIHKETIRCQLEIHDKMVEQIIELSPSLKSNKNDHSDHVWRNKYTRKETKSKIYLIRQPYAGMAMKIKIIVGAIVHATLISCPSKRTGKKRGICKREQMHCNC